MKTFSVKVVGDTKLQSVTADEFQIDDGGNLSFLDRSQQAGRKVAVFAAGQWQFFEETA
jgi:hypothetical protein